MDTVLINKLQYLQIGQQGENAANNIPIDMTPWVEEFPNANFHLLFKAYNATSPLPMVTDYNGETHVLTWTPTLSATAVAGVGYTEVRALDDGVLKKSRIIPTTVENSVTGVEGGTVPLPYEDWVNLVLSYKDAAEDAQADAETAQGKAEDAQAAAETAEDNAEAWAVGQKDGVDVPDTDPTYHNNSKYYKELAETARGTALQNQYNAEAWAVGKKNNVDVESTDPTYHNNSKYYSEQSNAYKTDAEHSAALMKNATGSVSMIPYGSTPTVTITEQTDHMNFAFAIPAPETPIIPDGTTSQKGIVQLEDSHTSTSTTKAATPNSVKEAYDLANTANTLAGSKANPSSVMSLTLAAGSWTSATPPTQTLTATGITANSKIIVGVASSATSAQWDAAADGKIRCTDQGTDSLTFTCYGYEPSENIPVTALIVG